MGSPTTLKITFSNIQPLYKRYTTICNRNGSRNTCNIMGVIGGFIMIPAMIYIISMPTKVVVGTSLFQIILATAFTTIMHATQNYTVDALLALLLLLGGVVGAQIGVRLGVKLKAEQLRILLSLIVLGVCLKLAFDLLHTPKNSFILVTF